MPIIQDQNRAEIRHAIGHNIGDVIISKATATVDTSSLQDSYALAPFGDDEINGRQVMIYDATGSIVDGEKSWVSDFASADATCAPVFSAAITVGDKYEMWKLFTIEEVNAVINQAIIDVTRKCLKPKQTETTYTERDKYRYNCLSGFEGVHTVEYCENNLESEIIDDCNSAWDASTDVTAATDSEIHRFGTNCVKLTVGDDVAAGAMLATNVISSTNFSNKDTVELWIYSTIDLAATYLEFYLDDTAACVSPVDTVSFPAISKDTWTRVQLTLTNPELDTAIISIGIGQETEVDITACTIWIDFIKSLKASSRKYIRLAPEHWKIINDGTDYLELTPTGKSIVGDNKLLRISGYQLPSLFTDDATDSDVDPQFIVNYATAYLMFYHAKSNRLEIDDRRKKAEGLMALCEKMKTRISTNIISGTKWVL